ncbi:MAG: hypothetical protein R3324_13610, partial [Halobacteriales archaeon]|nr:hypothetical protein [Halobacteriales archaeon]
DLRAGRRVYPDSTTQVLHFWVDQNQNSVEELTEQVCYVVRTIDGETDRWRLVRWTVDAAACTTSTVPSSGRTIAATLRNPTSPTVAPDVFAFDCNGSSPCPPTDPTSSDVVREVTIDFQLDVRTDAGPDTLPMTATVRLRNVA